MGELQQTLDQAAGFENKGKEDRKKEIRKLVNLLLPDLLMIVLAVIMVPIVLLPLFLELSDPLVTALQFIDYAILSIFVIEYILKTILAKNILKHIINPWHLLDLFVILVPLINLFPAVSLRYGSSTLILRLLRIIRVVAMGGRAVDRKIQLAVAVPEAIVQEVKPLEIQVIDGNFENYYQNVPFGKLDEYIKNPYQTWIDISNVSEADLDKLSNSLGIPRILLESELTEESYPRVDYFEHYSLIFARIADIQLSQKDATRLAIDRRGILVVCQEQNIITISKTKTDIFKQITKQAQKALGSDGPLVVTILYTILKHILEKDKQIIAALEHRLMVLESIPLNKRPGNFLEVTFYLRKEVNQIVPSLLHLKEIISVITSKQVPLEGFCEKHEKIFDILMDEAVYLHETASSARDNLQSLVDLYINTNSFQTNQVMRIIAVITSLGIIPAVMGLLGSNIAGNPWDIQLWQVFGLLGFIVLAMIWIFYRMGWLKG
jgi:Mg2+ and Co2+ transporter CorA